MVDIDLPSAAAPAGAPGVWSRLIGASKAGAAFGAVKKNKTPTKSVLPERQTLGGKGTSLSLGRIRRSVDSETLLRDRMSARRLDRGEELHEVQLKSFTRWW